MKNLFNGLLAVALLISLAGCKKKCCDHTAVVEERITKRISGPIADTTITWTEEDLK